MVAQNKGRRGRRIRETRSSYRTRSVRAVGVEPASHEEPPGSRHLEVQWIDQHRDELRRRFAGQWIVVEGDKLVAHDRDLQKAVKRAHMLGVRYPFVSFVRLKRYEEAYEAV